MHSFSLPLLYGVPISLSLNVYYLAILTISLLAPFPGHDPDRVASDSSQPATHLTNIGVTPGPRHEGSIRPLVHGKRDIELTSLTLSEEQVRYRIRDIELTSLTV